MRHEHAHRDPDAPSSMIASWHRFQASMLERLEVLESVGAEFLEEAAGAESMRAAQEAAGSLYRSLRRFRMKRGADLVAEVEELIADEPPGPGATFRYCELVVALRVAIEEANAPGLSGSAAITGEPEEVGVVLIVEADPEVAEGLSAEAMHRGWRPEPVPTLAAARSRVGEVEGALAAIVDPRSGDEEALVALLRSLRRGSPPAAVVFHTGDVSQEERLQAVTLGAGAFVAKSASPSAMLDRVEALAAAAAPEVATVLVVDQDEALMQAMSASLTTAGVEVRTLQDPLKLWVTLEEVAPDLLILAAEMAGVSGHRLCRTMRADPRWQSLPILFLTRSPEPAVIAAGFEAGADDVLVKPVSWPVLKARVEGRLLRRPAVVGPGGVDEQGTGASVQELLTLQLAIAARHETVLSVAVVALESRDEGWAHKVANALTEAARGEDVVVRTRTGALVGRYGESSDRTRRWLNSVLQAHGEPGFRLGIAEYPGLDTPDALVEGARAALQASSRSGAAAVSRTAQAVADIVVVEDDEAVGSLLTRTLDKRGYRTHWIRDGAEASRLLTGDSPALRAKLILLDVGLPGVDGFTILRRLRRDGVTPRTRVVMVTGRASRGEVIRALELGAFDHVAKPFSMSEFLHRVRRAMGQKGGS